MKPILINALNWNLAYARQLVIDLDSDLLTTSPGVGLENHPAWTLGHLVSAAALTSKYLGGPYEIDKQWEELFRRNGPGDPRLPDPDTSLYPDKEELLSELERQYNQIINLIRDLDPQRLNEKVQWRLKENLPTLGDLLTFMCLTHTSMHLGQLAAWRRAMGLSSALAEMSLTNLVVLSIDLQIDSTVSRT